MTQVADSSHLVSQTREHLRRLAANLLQWAATTTQPREFYARWLAGLCEAIAARHATLYFRQGERWQVLDRHNAATVGEPPSPPAELLDRMLEAGPGTLGPDDEQNPSDELLFLLPLSSEPASPLVVVVGQRPDVAPGAVDGQLRFLFQLMASADQFARLQRGRVAEEHNRWLSAIEQYCREVYAAGSARETAAAIANAGLRPTAAERVAVMRGRGRDGRILAFSGQESFERRTPVVRRLESLAAAVTRYGLPFRGRRDGDPETDTGGLPTPAVIGRAWQAYAQESHAQAVVILPLAVPQPPPAQAAGGPTALAPLPRDEVTGALILEWFDGEPQLTPWARRWDVVADHAALALQRFQPRGGGLLGVLKRSSGRLVRWLVMLGVLASIVAALVLVPYEFAIHSRGAVQPVVRRDVFSPSDGEVAGVTVRHGQRVTAGEVLVELGNDALDYQLQQTLAQLRQARTTIETVQKQLHDPRLPATNRAELIARLTAAEEQQVNLQEQRGLLIARRERLVAKSPIEGQVITWNVAETLMARPVKEGQVLLTVADGEGPWQLEIPMAEDRLGELLRAQDQASSPLDVEFILATDPHTAHRGRVERVAERAELDDELRNTVLVIVAFDKSRLPRELLRPGASATVKIHCGERPLGEVLFHDLAQWFRREVWFRM